MCGLFLALAQCLLFTTLVQAHVVLTYPGWRGNNLGRNEDSPFGMQWMYPCGGLSVTTNRTHWPINGGGVSLQPGWFTGHETALMYINIGLGEQPENYSWPITTFYLKGPTDNPYPGGVCLPQLTLPEAVRSRVKSGDFATIQVVEATKHGAGLFTCADIILTDDNSKVPPLNERNCFNSSDIDISDVAILGSQQLPSACAELDAAAMPVATTPANAASAAITTSVGAGENGVRGMREGSGATAAALVMLSFVVLSVSGAW